MKDEFREKVYNPTLFLEITNKCNLGCSYCYIHNKGKEVEPVQVGDLINAIDVTQPSKVIITGGEPLLYPELIYNLMYYYELNHGIHWRVTLFTNLMIDIDDRILKVLKYMDAIQTTWSYDRSIEHTGSDIPNIEVLKKNIDYIRSNVSNVKYIDANVTVTFYTLKKSSPKQLIEELEYLGVNGVNFETVSLVTDRDLSEYYTEADEFILECFKLLESKPNIENILSTNWKMAIDNGMTLHCTVCEDSNTRLFDPITKTLKTTCPCYVPQGSRRKKFEEKCIYCDYFKYCRMDCERYGNHCAFLFKTFDYFKSQLETL